MTAEISGQAGLQGRREQHRCVFDQPIDRRADETQKIHPRTFHIDPSGRLLVAQHNLPVNVRDGDAVKTVPAGLSVFRIGDDGKLTFARN